MTDLLFQKAHSIGVLEFIQFNLYVTSEIFVIFMKIFEEKLPCGAYFVEESNNFKNECKHNLNLRQSVISDNQRMQEETTIVQCIAGCKIMPDLKLQIKQSSLANFSELKTGDFLNVSSKDFDHTNQEN